MGKSPGKWFRSLITGKKSSKSKLSKGTDVLKYTNKGELLVASEPPVPDTTVGNSLISQLPPTDGFSSVGVQGNGEAAKLPNEEFASSCAQGDKNVVEVTNSGLQEDPERVRHETAATKAQAAFRGYQARCAFRTLKSIIRLQALIRGHLVRRQAIATLCCVRAIVRFQALARGHKVRCSAVGIEAQNVCNQGKIQGTIYSDSSGKCTSFRDEKLIKNVFAQKLLASSSLAIPLNLQYCPGESNSSWVWLERWTKSHFWGSHSQQQKSSKHGTLKKVETKQGRPKRNVSNHSRSNAENSSGRLAKESGKPKRKPRKVSGQPADSVQEHPEIELEKVNHSSKKAFDSTKEVRETLDVRGKTNRSVRKSPVVANSEVSPGTDEGPEEVIKDSEAHASLELPTMDNHVEALHECHDLDMQPVQSNIKVDIQETNEQLNLIPGNDEHDDLGSQPVGNSCRLDGVQGENKQLNQRDHNTSNENQKTNERRASFPLNVEHQEKGSTPKVPSYMAPTESARAKLRGQGSPRFSQDATENIVITRRHSLPTSTNGKLTSMSPRAQKLVHAAGKGLVRSDRSLSSSRDGTVSDKVMKPEWRR